MQGKIKFMKWKWLGHWPLTKVDVYTLRDIGEFAMVSFDNISLVESDYCLILEIKNLRDNSCNFKQMSPDDILYFCNRGNGFVLLSLNNEDT